jgi:hypothetical protein
MRKRMTWRSGPGAWLRLPFLIDMGMAALLDVDVSTTALLKS